MSEVFDRTGYIMCPHTAVGYLGLKDYLKDKENNLVGVYLATADPSKFADIVENQIKQPVEIPQRLQEIVSKEKVSIKMGKDFAGFKQWLLS